MPYYLIQLGNGYTYQTFAGSPEEALAKARSRAPAGVSVGGTDLAAAQVISQGANVPFDGYRDEMGAVPGIGQPGGGQPGAGVGPGGTGPAVPPPPIIDPPRPPPPQFPPQQPPPQPPPGGGGGTGGTPPVPPPVAPPPPFGGTGGLPELSPGLSDTDARNALFLRGLADRFGIGVGDLSNTFVGREGQRRQGEFENVFRFQRAISGFANPFSPTGADEDPSGPFQQFITNTSTPELRQEAARVLGTLTGHGQSPVQGLDSLRAALANPDVNTSRDVVGLLETALANRISPLGLQLIRTPSADELRNRFIAETGGAPQGRAGPASFLDFVLRNFPMASSAAR